jgi:hypothetical protein
VAVTPSAVLSWDLGFLTMATNFVS